MNQTQPTAPGGGGPPPVPPVPLVPIDLALAAEKVTKAKTILLADYPWFGTLAIRLRFGPGNVGTLATDGTRLLYEPAFVNRQPLPELIGGIAHETLHCGLLHPFRFANRDHAEWNISCDYA